MDYDSLDWDAEAKRVARAFEVVNECQFVDVPQFAGGVRKSLLRPCASFLKRLFNPRLRHCKREPFTRNGLLLSISYRPANGALDCVFALTDNWIRPRLDRDMVAVSFSHNGAVVTDALVRDDHKYSDVLAKGLFHLGMLMPEIEAALQISVSAHEKLEWAREHEERLECEAIDWDAEAVRVARAFGVVGEYNFEDDGGDRHLRRPMSWFAVVKSYFFCIPERYRRQIPISLPTEDRLYLTVNYHPAIYHSSKRFKLSDSEIAYKTRGETGVSFHHQGIKIYTAPYQNLYAHQMAKGLFHLNLLTPEVEEKLGVSISAHEKMEWAIEYEERYGL